MTIEIAQVLATGFYEGMAALSVPLAIAMIINTFFK